MLQKEFPMYMHFTTLLGRINTSVPGAPILMNYPCLPAFKIRDELKFIIITSLKWDRRNYIFVWRQNQNWEALFKLNYASKHMKERNKAVTIAWTFAGLLGSLCTLLIINREYNTHADRKYNRKNIIRMRSRYRRHSKNTIIKKDNDNGSNN